MRAVRGKDGELPITLHASMSAPSQRRRRSTLATTAGIPFASRCVNATDPSVLEESTFPSTAVTAVPTPRWTTRVVLGIAAVVQRQPRLSPVLGYQDGLVVVDADGG